jgi:hypothetical protein
MFLAFAPEVLDDWLRRANREAAAAAAAAEEGGEDDPFGEPDDLVTRQARVLARLYREMHASAKDEFAAAATVFPKPGLALELFLSRLLEQNVQAVLERLLLPSSIGMATLAAAAQQQQQQHGGGASPRRGAQRPTLAATKGGGHSRNSSGGSFMERASNLATSFAGASGAAAAAAAVAAVGGIGGAAASGDEALNGDSELPGLADAAALQSAGLQRQRLRLLVEAYHKTQRLATNLEKSVRPVVAMDVVSMAEGLWPAFLGSYPEQELEWLAAACSEEVCVCGWLMVSGAG